MIYDRDKKHIDDDDLWDDELDLDPVPGEDAGMPDRDAEPEQPDPAEASDYYDDDDDAADDGAVAGDDPDAEPDSPDAEPEHDATAAPAAAAGGSVAGGTAAAREPRRSRIFGMDRDDDGHDYFDPDSDIDEPEPERRPKAPKLDPEDPDYWIDDDSGIGHILPKPKSVWKWWLAGGAACVALIAACWMWFLRPHTDGAVRYGYLKHMERRGTVIKTFEGVLIPYRELGDTTPTYFEEVRFSVEGDSLAAAMKGMMLGCVPVRLEYETYHTALPWKGCERMVVVKADTADTSRILPPEYR